MTIKGWLARKAWDMTKAVIHENIVVPVLNKLEDAWFATAGPLGHIFEASLKNVTESLLAAGVLPKNWVPTDITFDLDQLIQEQAARLAEVAAAKPIIAQIREAGSINRYLRQIGDTSEAAQRAAQRALTAVANYEAETARTAQQIA